MAFKVRWSQYAAEQLQVAALYLEESRRGSGREFVDEIERVLDLVAEYPLASPRVPDEPCETRKAIVPRFGYWVVYEVHDDAIVILAVWHAVRSPGSWRERDGP